MAPDSTIPLSSAILREISIRSSYGSTPASWHRALALLAPAASDSTPSSPASCP